MTIQEARKALESNLSLVQEIALSQSRRSGLGRADREDFISTVMLKMVENDYGVLRSFRGRSSLRTYLCIVIRRILLDYQIRLWGKWRSSAKAKRLGSMAVRLERLLFRDGFRLDEACSTLRIQHGVELSTRSLEQLAARLPCKHRRQFVSLEGTENLMAATGFQYESLSKRELRLLSRHLQEAVASLPEEDRLILKMRYQDSVKVCRIAKVFGVPAKPLYRRFEKILLRLRSRIEALGWQGEDIVLLDKSPGLRSLRYGLPGEEAAGIPALKRPNLRNARPLERTRWPASCRPGEP